MAARKHSVVPVVVGQLVVVEVVGKNIVRLAAAPTVVGVGIHLGPIVGVVLAGR